MADKPKESSKKRVDGQFVLIIFIILVVIVTPIALSIWFTGEPIKELN